MKNRISTNLKIGWFLVVLILISGISFGQTGKLTYPMLITALNAKLPKGMTRQNLITKLIDDVKKRGVDKPLTPDREDDLRQAGATNELIDAIRSNSPSTPKATPTVTPRSTPVVSPTISQIATSSPKPGDSRKNSIGMDLVFIPPGEFIMGSETGDQDEKPPHKVSISHGFWMGKFEVKQSQYENVIGTNPSYFTRCDDCPVEQVSWEDAKEFISRLNAKNDGYIYSLPTEAQWEYAASPGPGGVYAGPLNDIAWYADNSGSRAHQVGTKKANTFGLYDMHGNVWEWCEDWYDRGYYSKSPAVDPKGPENGTERVLHGGSWGDSAKFTRAANRSGNAPSLRVKYVGFRIVARGK